MKSLRLKVVTTSGQTLMEDAVSVRAPGERGYMGILYNHAPLVNVLRAGRLTWRSPGGVAHAVRIGTGLLEVAKNRVMILTDALEEPAAP